MNFPAKVWRGAAAALAIGVMVCRVMMGAEPASVEPVKSLASHAGKITDVAVHPDGKVVAVVGETGETRRPITLKIWNVDTETSLATLDAGAPVVAISPDGARLAFVTAKGSLTVCELSTRRVLQTIAPPSEVTFAGSLLGSGAEHLQFSADGSRLAMSVSSRVLGYNTQTGKPAFDQQVDNSIYGMALFPDGRRVLIGDSEGNAQIWDLEAKKKLSTLGGGGFEIGGAAVSPDGKLVVTQAYEETAIVWQADSGKKFSELSDSAVLGDDFLFLPDNRTIAGPAGVFELGRQVDLWSAATGQRTAELKGHMAGVSAVGRSKDGKRLVSGDSDGKLLVWDVGRFVGK